MPKDIKILGDMILPVGQMTIRILLKQLSIRIPPSATTLFSALEEDFAKACTLPIGLSSWPWPVRFGHSI